ncbi:glycan metabolism protein RagB [Flavobacterium rivuli WB 3.3-2 = DSM 21788]|uniref:Glycan metabolism protein RagB n=1 Tax=Flavobacterium rivuli WB 3.3-2 = DSM 21788 TaxID=1121895 RepID=A0A0A2MD50_9FLAO|nr:RagB/SusD family nutrient uptake outer membrane protein [Flavobacterium rivuli]KGO86200.1 glycan metabolism protein RagB [Flavobacterium rivuli WB 3.3-2 = DSM 21788]
MKTIKYKFLSPAKVLCVITMSVLTIGCTEDFLDKQPLDQISDATFWKTENDAMLALTGCYNIGAYWAGQDFFNGISLLWLDLAAGDGSEKEFYPDHMTDGTLNSSYWVTAAYWSNTYGKISKCNNFLDHIDAVPMDEVKKAMMKAEIRTLRAYCYFNLALYFGNVPLSTHLLTVEEANNIPQTSRADVWAFAEQELAASYPDLPSTRPSNEDGRITAGASLAFLGRVQMAEQKWHDAALTYKQIIDSQVYIIDQAGFAQLFWQTGESSKEVIFSTQYQPDVYAQVLPQYLYPETYGGWHQFSPYNELVQSYECTDGKTIELSPLYNSSTPYDNRDPRLDYTIMISDRTQFKGVTYVSRPDSSSPDRISRYSWSGYCINKLMDPTFDGNLMNYGGNFPVVRYPEVLLGYLESKLEAGEGITQSLLDETVNLIRNRPTVNMPDVTTTDPNAVREILRRERKVELAFEGIHYYDILRWGTAGQELNRQFTGMKLTNTPESYSDYPVDSNGFYIYQRRNFIVGVNELWPIPQTELNINKNLVQNPGY